MGGYEDPANSWRNTSWLNSWWPRQEGFQLSCCSQLSRGEEHELLRGPEKQYILEQPSLILPPVAQYPYRATGTTTPTYQVKVVAEPDLKKSKTQNLLDRVREAARETTTLSQITFKRQNNTSNGTRRPLQISGPTNFVHVSSGYRRESEEKKNKKNFRPLELSIYNEKRLSPLLPHFKHEPSSPLDQTFLKMPPVAMTSEEAADFELSQFGFSIPRKAVNTRLSISATTMVTRFSIDSLRPIASRGSEWISQPLRPPPNWMDSSSTVDLLNALEKALPQLPPAARLKPETSRQTVKERVQRFEQIGRVQSALLENLELDRRLREIDLVIQRQSISLSRRSSMSRDEEYIHGRHSPIPAVPPIPKEIPNPITPLSRFNTQTKPSRPRPTLNTKLHTQTPKESVVVIENRLLSPTSDDEDDEWDTKDESPLSPKSKPQSPFSKEEEVFDSPCSPIPPPPLPLVLHQPPQALRRKKSFSRVSKWLWSNSDPKKHSRSFSLDSVTNQPQPVTSRDGFYQCVNITKQNNIHRESIASFSTYDSVLDEPVIPTEWTPNSTPATANYKEGRSELGRVRTFGPQSRRKSINVVLDLHEFVYDNQPVRLSYVGVAY